MASTHTSLHYHVVFSTKNRERTIVPAVRDELHHYLGGTVNGLGGQTLRVGGIEDHVHMVFGLKTTHCIADVLREIKKASSGWMHEQQHRLFAWQDGYGAFTVSRSSLPSVLRYVAEQEKHHAHRSFEDEYRELLELHEIEYDERYLW